MGSFRSKEDDLSKISTSIFVSNFSKSFSAKDLFHSCKQYGHVVDSFIPTKRPKDDNVVRTNSNANVVRNSSNSYVYAVKGGSLSNGEKDNSPVLVLDDSCTNEMDFSLCLNGKVKEIGALLNLKVVMRNEGFSDPELSYLGGLWVMIGFKSTDVKEKFLSCVAIKSWFEQLIQASEEFIIDDRIIWVDLEGITLKLWTFNSFKKIASKWGLLLNDETSEDSNFHSKRLCILTKRMDNIYESFKISYRGKVHWIRAKEISGWIPDFDEHSEEDSDSESEPSNDGVKENFDRNEDEQSGEV
ncbi:nucleotide-binding alpha-beta plait domain-containing protein [Tanacetum coccineum]